MSGRAQASPDPGVVQELLDEVRALRVDKARLTQELEDLRRAHGKPDPERLRLESEVGRLRQLVAAKESAAERLEEALRPIVERLQKELDAPPRQD